MVSSARYKIVFSLIVVILFLGGCATFHDLYFERNDVADVYLGPYRVALRIFAHQNKKVMAEGTDSSDYHVSVQVVSPEQRDDSEAWTEDPEQVNLRSEQFLQRVQSEFEIDSLAFHPLQPEDDPIILLHDGESFSPRRDDYFTLQFGLVEIPLETRQLQAVLYVTRGGEQLVADSVVWLMNRVDRYERGLAMFRRNVRGYE